MALQLRAVSYENKLNYKQAVNRNKLGIKARSASQVQAVVSRLID